MLLTETILNELKLSKILKNETYLHFSGMLK